MKRGLLIITFISILMLGALHQIGSALYLYWDIPWFDMLMHFLGGFSIGMLFVWAWYGSDMLGRRSMPARASTVLATIAFVFAVGAAWEVFEYVFDIANPTGGNYSLDTFNDFIADLLGALFAGAVGTIKRFHE
jgi:hypothetical protein